MFRLEIDIDVPKFYVAQGLDNKYIFKMALRIMQSSRVRTLSG